VLRITSKSTRAKQPRPLWQNRDYILLLSGQTISSFGTQASQLAFPLLILTLTHSPIYAGLIGAIRLIPYVVLGLLAGAWVDRVDRKRLMISCDIIRALVLGSIPLLSLFGMLTPIQLYVAALVEGSLYVFFNIAETSCLPNVVPKEQLTTALAQDRVANGAASLLGPSLGGTLYSFHQLFPFLVDAISYTISVISLLFVRTSFQREKRIVAQRKISTEIAEGLHWLWRQPLIRFITFSGVVVNFLYAGNTLLVITLLQRQKASSVVIGLILAVGSVGQIAGSLLGPIIQKRFGYRHIAIGLAWGFFVSWSLYLFAFTPLLIGIITALLYLNLPIQIVAVSTICAMLIPDEMRGRVTSVIQTIAWCAMPLSNLANGALLQLVGPMETILLFSGGFLIIAVVISVNPHIRNAPSWAELQRLHDLAKEAHEIHSQEETRAISHQGSVHVIEEQLKAESLDFSGAKSSNLLSKPSLQQAIDEQVKLLLQRNLEINGKQKKSEHHETVQIINRLALLYCKQGKYKQAEPLLQRALAICEQHLGSKHPETAQNLNSLAVLYYELGKYKQAKPLLQHALNIREQQLGAEHPETAQSLNSLALLYCKRSKYKQAKQLLKRALVIRKQHVGAEHPDTAQSFSSLALLYYELGKYKQAEQLLRRSLAICEQQLGAEHPETAQSLNGLAQLYYEQGKYKQAKLLSQRALAIQEQHLEFDHPQIAQSLNTLAVLYYEQGEYKQAKPLLQRALAIRKQQLGSKHPETAQSFNSLAMLYCKQGKYEQAEPLLQRALAIREQHLGPEHPETAQSLNSLALLYYEQGKYKQAESLLRRAFAIRKQQLGPEHPKTVQSLNLLLKDLSELRSQQNQTVPLRRAIPSELLEESEHLDTEPLEDTAQMHSHNNPAVPLYQRNLNTSAFQFKPKDSSRAIGFDKVQGLNNLAILYSERGKNDLAEPFLQHALSISEQQLGPEHPDTLQSLNNLAALYYKQGKYEQAEPLYQRALSISERHLGPEHPDTAKNLNNLAVLYRKQDKYKRAEPLYQRALTINEQQLGPEHPETVQILNNLAILYRKQGKYEQAKPLYQRALHISERQLGSQHPQTEKLRQNYFFLLRTMGYEDQARQAELVKRS
jgi:tetratricopeptide (TPR) repeat protein/MFS family permease